MSTCLTRTVRFFLPIGGSAPAEACKLPIHNSHAGWPPPLGLSTFFELLATCRGSPDPQTGYLINITEIDQALRKIALPLLSEAMRSGAATPLGSLMIRMAGQARSALAVELIRLELRLSPTTSVALENPDMPNLSLCQQYEFSAAHRLHVADFSEEKNREYFGKCNNPAGHGHNYRLQVEVAAEPATDGTLPLIHELDALIDGLVIRRFDHKHLNIDLPEFAAVNPSVENIARVIWEILDPGVRPLGVRLKTIRVWETEKTVCTYSAD